MWALLRMSALILIAVVSGFSRADAPLQVLTSIKPLQLIALAVGGNEVKVDALLDPRGSPHDYQLRPSDRAKLDAADAVFWVGPQLEHFLQPALKVLSARVTVVALQDHMADPHIWIDPVAMQTVAQQMATVYSALRPARAEYFRANALRVQAELQQSDRFLQHLFPVDAPRRGYIVEHDAYSRFEGRYGLKHLAALTDNSDLPPSVSTVLKVKRLLDSGEIACALAEIQESSQLRALTEDRSIRLIKLDSLAANVPISDQALPDFYRQLGESIAGCLKI
ncbi:MAG: hypothetical protein JWM78_2003 [Verrucomicrobiaceae bacterium]|nr:hypothetical protein [Verrucomicrobiaceae bacterium]